MDPVFKFIQAGEPLLDTCDSSLATLMTYLQLPEHF